MDEQRNGLASLHWRHCHSPEEISNKTQLLSSSATTVRNVYKQYPKIRESRLVNLYMCSTHSTTHAQEASGTFRTRGLYFFVFCNSIASTMWKVPVHYTECTRCDVNTDQIYVTLLCACCVTPTLAIRVVFPILPIKSHVTSSPAKHAFSVCVA